MEKAFAVLTVKERRGPQKLHAVVGIRLVVEMLRTPNLM
jgi:hypothetical protein